MSPGLIALASAASSAALAGWIVVRFRKLGPARLRSSLVVCGTALVALQVLAPAMGLVAAKGSPAFALVLVAVPTLTFAFWSGGVLIRAFASGAFNRS